MENDFEEFIRFRCTELIKERGMFDNPKEEEIFIRNYIGVLSENYKRGFLDALKLNIVH